MWVSGIKRSDWFVAIGGFKVSRVTDPRALVKAVGESASPQFVQIVDAGRVAGREHLYMAAVNAARSTKTGLAVSKSITVEALLYASAQDQITKALIRLGVNADSKKVALIIFAHSQEEAREAYRKASKLLGIEDDGVLEIDSEKVRVLKEAFSIRDEEIEAVGGLDALSGLIIERGSLLSLHR